MLTVPEAASRLNVAAETVRRWIRSGRLKSVKVGTQHLLDEADIDAMRADTLPVPRAWRWSKTVSGRSMPDAVAAVRRSRLGH